MLASMTWEQLLEWMEIDRIDPFGGKREDLRMGIMTSNIVNILLQVNAGKRRPKLTKPSDFIPKFEEETKRSASRKPITSASEWAEIKAMAKIYAGA